MVALFRSARVCKDLHMQCGRVCTTRYFACATYAAAVNMIIGNATLRVQDICDIVETTAVASRW